MENFLSKLQDGGGESCSPPRSPYPYLCLTPISSGAGKLCVDKDRTRQMEQKFLKRKIKKDKNLITTTDIEKLEETFTRNCRSKMASATEIAIPDSLQTGMHICFICLQTDIHIFIFLSSDIYIYLYICFQTGIHIFKSTSNVAKNHSNPKSNMVIFKICYLLILLNFGKDRAHAGIRN